MQSHNGWIILEKICILVVNILKPSDGGGSSPF